MKKHEPSADNATPGSPEMVFSEEIMINIEPEVVYIKQEPRCEEDVWNELEPPEDIKLFPTPLAAPDLALVQEVSSILEKRFAVPNCSVILERIQGEELSDLSQASPQNDALTPALNGVSLRGRRRRPPRAYSPDSYTVHTPTHTKPRKNTPKYKTCTEKDTLSSELEKACNSLQDIRIEADNKLLSCHICHQKFRTYPILHNHIRVHTGERPYSCQTCKMNFTQRSALKRHERVHTGERPFSCPTCKKNFIQSSNLKTHLRVHTGEKPFSCTICNKNFTHYSNLKLHERVHTKIPYSCLICKKQFTKSSHLENHKRVHTGEWPFSCEICQKNFTRFCHLKNHERVHTQIDHCSVSF